MYTCKQNFKLQVQIEESIYLQVHNLGYRYLWVQKISYVYSNIFFIFDFAKLSSSPVPVKSNLNWELSIFEPLLDYIGRWDLVVWLVIH